MSNNDLDDTAFSPIFIVGHSRSGSTLLASIFSEHSNILSLPETHFFTKTYSNNVFSRVCNHSSKSLIDELYKNNRIQDVGLMRVDLERHLGSRSITSYRQLYELFLKVALERSDKVRVLEKTPRHIEFVDLIFKYFPLAKVICTVRDGRDAVHSLMNAPWTHSNKARHAAYWAWCVREAQRLKLKYPLSFTVVRYEDLVDSPDLTMQRLCEFIQEPFEGRMLKAERSNSTVPKWERAWKEKSKAQLDPNYLYQWKKDPKLTSSSVYIQYFMLDELISMNYQKVSEAMLIVPFMKKVLWHRAVFKLFFRATYLLRTHLLPRKNDYRYRDIKATSTK